MPEQVHASGHAVYPRSWPAEAGPPAHFRETPLQGMPQFAKCASQLGHLVFARERQVQLVLTTLHGNGSITIPIDPRIHIPT